MLKRVRSEVGLLLLFCSVVGAALIVTLCLERSVAGDDAWYATFEYNGQTYAYSHAAEETTWKRIVGRDYAYAENPAPDGNAGEKGQPWCNETLITSGTDDQYDDWFLPNFDESIAGRNRYEGNNPLNLQVPADCYDGHFNGGLPALWSSTTCFEGTTACDRAFFVYDTGTRVYDDNVPQYLHCENGGSGSHWCCMKKKDYGIIHTCPMARCVRIVEPPTHWADFDQDGDVDAADVALVASCWRHVPDGSNCDAAYDVDGDGIITVVDITLVAAECGWTSS
jgi:hypothetical protein